VCQNATTEGHVVCAGNELRDFIVREIFEEFCPGNLAAGRAWRHPRDPMENNSKQEQPSPAPQPQRRAANQQRRIAVLTSGDAPGMKAAIRSVSRIAGAAGIEVVGVQRAFEGLLYTAFADWS
jgi:hypothetical protein